VSKWIGLSITLFFLVLLAVKFSAAGWASAFVSLQQVDILLFLTGILLMIFSAWLQAVRWRLILLPLGIFTSLEIFRSVVIGHWFNLLLPLRLGEIARPYHFSRTHRLNFTTILASTIIERLLDLIAVLTLAWICILIFSITNAFYYALTGSAIYILILSLIIFFVRRRDKLHDIINCVPVKKLKDWGLRYESDFFSGLALVNNFNRIITVALATLPIWIVNILAYWILIKSCRLPNPISTLGAGLSVTLASAVGHAIPSTGTGLGVINYGVVLALTEFARSVSFNFSLAEVSILRASIVVYIAAIIPDLFIGGYFYWRDRNLFEL
jgi:uncharacterized protein (TIRG00374 family)